MIVANMMSAFATEVVRGFEAEVYGSHPDAAPFGTECVNYRQFTVLIDSGPGAPAPDLLGGILARKVLKVGKPVSFAQLPLLGADITSIAVTSGDGVRVVAMRGYDLRDDKWYWRVSVGVRFQEPDAAKATTP